MTRPFTIISIAIASLLVASPSTAQPLGAFYWQLEPYCNVVAVHVTGQLTLSGPVYALTGFDDRCGALARSALVGTAMFNHDGSIGIGLTIVTTPGGAPVHVDARIDIRTSRGAWTDSAGNAGALAPLSPSTAAGLHDRSWTAAGSPRPVPANGIAPGSILSTQLAPGAIGAAQLAPGAVGAVQIDPSQVQARVTESCPAGQYLRSIKGDGTVECEPGAAQSRAAHSVGSGAGLLDIDTIVHAVTLEVGTAGTVFVNASGNFNLFHLTGSAPRAIVRAWCSISAGTSLDLGFEADVVMTIVRPDNAQIVPFGLTRGFEVGPGTFTANLVCRHFLQGTASVDNPSLTALFVPAR